MPEPSQVSVEFGSGCVPPLMECLWFWLRLERTLFSSKIILYIFFFTLPLWCSGKSTGLEEKEALCSRLSLWLTVWPWVSHSILMPCFLLWKIIELEAYNCSHLFKIANSGTKQIFYKTLNIWICDTWVNFKTNILVILVSKETPCIIWYTSF